MERPGAVQDFHPLRRARTADDRDLGRRLLEARLDAQARLAVSRAASDSVRFTRVGLVRGRLVTPLGAGVA